jgi:elongator complex protein 1
LLFLTNDRELFDAALSTGDLAVAHLVAMNSQAMDPGEFMPELQHLHEMREFERQATISERLEMWKDAAKFWLKDKSLEKASNVAAKHGLFPYLHELCEEENGDDSAETRKVITKYHARYLESVVNRAEDAGVAFLKCGEYESALRCFTGVSSASSSSSSKSTGSGSSSWRSGFIVAKEKLKFSDEEMMKLASETCKNLEQSSNDYVSAAVVALDYLNDVERAVANFALANKWRDAKLTCFSKNRSDLFETTVFPECVVGATKLLEHFEDVQARSDKYRERLIGLQERRKLYKKTFASVEEGRMRPRRAANLDGSEDDEYDDIKDNISEINSEFSNVSGYSLYATSTQFGDGSAISQQSSSRWSASTVGGRRNKKSRKNKNKKNKNGLRAGGPTEERDLSSHVITDVRVSEEKLEECAEICEILIASDNSSDAKVLQNAASVAIEKCKLMRVAARESLKQLIEEKEKEEEYIMLVSSSANNNGVLPPELMERKREIEADLKTMRESMNANAKDDVDVVSFKWSSIRTASK